MNQILVTERLYITPELKRKKRMYKIRFFLSVFLICVLFSYYIYAENDRNKSEEVGQQLLSQIDKRKENNAIENDNTTRNIINDVLIVAIDTNESNNMEEQIQEYIPAQEEETSQEIYTTDSGEEYTIDSRLTIPKLGIDYAVLSETSEELLKISLNKYWGQGPNQVGNYCIVGHNYANGKLFGKLYQMEIGDTAVLQDMSTGKSVTYEAYNKFVVDPTDVSCTSQLTNGKREMTLITCKNYGTQRLVIKCREV